MTEQDRRKADQRIGALEKDMGKVIVFLEGEPVKDIRGNLIGTEGGLVRQGERSVRQGEQNAEALHVISHTLTGILEQLNGVRKPWSLTQRIAMSGVLVTFLLGSIPMITWLIS